MTISKKDYRFRFVQNLNADKNFESEKLEVEILKKITEL